MIVLQQQPFGHHEAITLSDTESNIVSFRYIQNVGTSGKVMIRQTGGYANSDIYLLTGQTMDTGQWWAGAMVTGTGAGVDLRGFV